MTAEIQSIEFLKDHYPKDRAIGWLQTNNYEKPTLYSKGNYWVFDVRPHKQFKTNSFYKRPVGNMNFVYGIMNFKLGRYRDRGADKNSRKGQNPLVDAMRDAKEPVAGSGVQSVRVPKDWGITKARDWVDNKGWSPDYYGKSPFTETDRWYRFRQTAPHKGDQYRIKTLPNKVQLVISS